MYENKKSSNCSTLNRNPDCPNSSNHPCWALGRTHRLGLAAVALSCWVVYAAADSFSPPNSPIKIAVFEFELEDFSAAGQTKPVPETSYLAQATDEAKQQLRASGRYTVIDAVHSDILVTKGQGLRNCGGCEAPIALSLGADEALIGVVTKISMTEYIVRFRLSNAHNGELIATYSTDLRMGADYSWSRGVRWLMQNRMLASK
jgi:Protein of unknown function (DUF2380)